MFKIKIYLKSGNIAEARVRSISVPKDSGSKLIKWDMARDWETLAYVDIESVEVITFEEETTKTDNDD